MKIQSIILVILLLIAFNPFQVNASSNNSNEVNANSNPTFSDSLIRNKTFRITELGFGGTALKVSSFNGQLAIMNGGRGYATINDRFLVGGGGYGIVNNISLTSDEPTVYNFFKMGYGGLELGYVLCKNRWINLNTTMLLGAGASFVECIPKGATESGFKMFSVIEPAINVEFSLNRLMKLSTGATYRFIRGANVSYMTDNAMCGPSVYVALLFGTCTCNM